jgi:hypothetical protein
MLKNGSMGAEGTITRVWKPRHEIVHLPQTLAKKHALGRNRKACAPHRENGVVALAARGNGDLHVAVFPLRQ